MKHKKVNLKTVDGFSIKGVHTITQQKSIILWLHGITVNKNEYLDLFKDGAEFVGNSGIDSLRIDFRGHGSSSGNSMDFTITGQMIDIDSAINYIRKYYKSEKIELHIVGCSFGAPPSIFTALKEMDIVKSIILIAPVLSYQRTFIEPETDWAASIFNNITITKLYKSNKIYFDKYFPVSMKFYQEMLLIKPEVLIGDVKQDITIIHGDCDSMVPYQVSKELALKFKNINLISVSDMDHGFNDMNDEVGNSEKSLKNKNNIYNIIKKNILNETI